MTRSSSSFREDEIDAWLQLYAKAMLSKDLQIIAASKPATTLYNKFKNMKQACIRARLEERSNGRERRG